MKNLSIRIKRIECFKVEKYFAWTIYDKRFPIKRYPILEGYGHKSEDSVIDELIKLSNDGYNFEKGLKIIGAVPKTDKKDLEIYGINLKPLEKEKIDKIKKGVKSILS